MASALISKATVTTNLLFASEWRDSYGMGVSTFDDFTMLPHLNTSAPLCDFKDRYMCFGQEELVFWRERKYQQYQWGSTTYKAMVTFATGSGKSYAPWHSIIKESEVDEAEIFHKTFKK